MADIHPLLQYEGSYQNKSKAAYATSPGHSISNILPIATSTSSTTAVSYNQKVYNYNVKFLQRTQSLHISYKMVTYEVELRRTHLL